MLVLYFLYFFKQAIRFFGFVISLYIDFMEGHISGMYSGKQFFCTEKEMYLYIFQLEFELKSTSNEYPLFYIHKGK